MTSFFEIIEAISDNFPIDLIIGQKLIQKYSLYSCGPLYISMIQNYLDELIVEVAAVCP